MVYDPSGLESVVLCKTIVAVVSMALFIMYFQIDIIAAQIVIAFNIPIHNTSIYLDKLVCLRSFMFVLGCTFEFAFFKVYMIVTGTIDEQNTRKKINRGFFILLLTLRVLLFLTSCLSYNPGFHVYIILGAESFFLGTCGSAIFAIVPQHVTVLVLFAHVSRFFTFFIQFFLDNIFVKSHIMRVRLQFLICLLLTIIATSLWFNNTSLKRCPNIKIKEPDIMDYLKSEETDTDKKYNFIQTFNKAFSPFIMYPFGCLHFDFLFPGILPFSFLRRDKCHLITLLLPLVNISGPIIFFSLETANKFNHWGPEHDCAWILGIPMVVIFIYCFLAMHTHIPSARRIINSRPRVMTMAFVSAFSFSFLDTLSFSGVSKVVFMSKDFIGDSGVIMAHQFFGQFIRFIFLKLSVGYNVTRIGLGYHFPKFRPTHRMSKWNTFWYILRNTFNIAAKDTVNDFKMNIKNYL